MYSGEVYFLRQKVPVDGEGNMSKILIVLKFVLICCLLFLFLKYFGLKSFERYNSQKVFVTKTWKRPDFLPSPAVTVCSGDLNSNTGFRNLSDEEIEAADKDTSLLELACKDIDGEELIRCSEEAMFNLQHVVEFEGYTHGFKPPKTKGVVESHWKTTLNSDKTLCLTYQDFQHFPTSVVLSIGLTKDLKHEVFFHDPNFFLKSENPDLPLNRDVLHPGKHQLTRLVVVEHQNLDVPDKRCSSKENYTFTNCVKEAFSLEVGCVLHWDYEDVALQLPKCTTIDQFKYINLFIQPKSNHCLTLSLTDSLLLLLLM